VSYGNVEQTFLYHLQRGCLTAIERGKKIRKQEVLQHLKLTCKCYVDMNGVLPDRFSLYNILLLLRGPLLVRVWGLICFGRKFGYT